MKANKFSGANMHLLNPKMVKPKSVQSNIGVSNFGNFNVNYGAGAIKNPIGNMAGVVRFKSAPKNKRIVNAETFNIYSKRIAGNPISKMYLGSDLRK